MVQELKEKLDKSKDEIGQIQSEVKFFEETVLVKREHETAASHSKPSFIGSEQSTAGSTSDEVNL